jgi:hypothetical protein
MWTRTYFNENLAREPGIIREKISAFKRYQVSGVRIDKSENYVVQNLNTET